MNMSEPRKRGRRHRIHTFEDTVLDIAKTVQALALARDDAQWIIEDLL